MRHDVSYGGDTDKGNLFFQHPVGIDFLCHSCGNNHRYAHEDIRMFPKDHSPEPGFIGIF
jgi:hypothetical protein